MLQRQRCLVKLSNKMVSLYIFRGCVIFFDTPSKIYKSYFFAILSFIRSE